MSSDVQSPATPWLFVIGIGEDGVDGLVPAARAAIEGAALVVGGARHLGLAAPLIRGERLPWPSPMRDGYASILARAGTPVAVLASGDPFCFGVGSVLAGLVEPGALACIPAPSAFSLAASRLRWPLQEVATVSLCGRPVETLIPHLHGGARILALSADASTPAAVARLLAARGFGGSLLHVMEALGGPRERIRSGHAVPEDVDPLNLVAIEAVAGPDAVTVPLAAGLPDTLFENDGQLTKQEVRAVTLAALAPAPGQVLWDVGCGSGAVGIEWCLRGRGTAAVAFEARADRAARAARNALALGATALDVVTGTAPACLAGRPGPAAAFIGGGFQNDGVFDAVWAALRPGGRLVANAVALDTQALLFDASRRVGGTLTRIAIERLDQIGSMRAFRPAMAIVQWTVVKR